MLKPRLALATVLVAVTLVPAAVARADVGAIDVIRDLATDAAELVTREQALIDLVEFNSDQPDTETAVGVETGTETETALRQIDAEAYVLLLQLDQLGVELTQAIRSAMEPLPRQSDAASAVVPQLVPPSVVYDAAIDDLLRIAATPASVAPVADRSRGQSFGLLAVAAGALLVLGIAALANTLRRRPEADELAAMAWSDGLTGLANRRRLDHDLASHRRAGGATSVILVDVDHFRAVNDVQGQQAGEDVLRQVATMLTHHVRFDDVVYRSGGEEFCILLPDASIDDARAVGRRIVEAARDIELPDESNITISVGVADGESADLTNVVESADRALDQARQSGRDCAVTASPTADDLTSA